MAGRHAFIVTGGVKLDWTGIQQDTTKWLGVMAKTMKPLTVKAQLAQPGDVGDAQGFLDGIKAKALYIESIVAKQKTMINRTTGEVRSGLTQMTTTYMTKTGEMATHTAQITSSVTGLGREWKKVDEDVVKATPGKTLRKVQAEIEATSARYKTMGEKATEWSTRAENMGSKERLAIQAASTALKKK